MLSDLAHFLSIQPLLALFLTIAAGYLLGAVNVSGFALGSGAVLFVGLAIGAAVPGLSLPPLLGNLGLLLFLYGVGIAYGAQFWRGLSSAEGARANLAAATAVGCALALTLAMVRWFPSVSLGQAMGAFSGAGTSTAALQAAIAAFGTGPATGYSVAYPLGVAVPILMLALYNALRKPAMPVRAASALHVEEIDVDEFSVLGMTLGEAADRLPQGIAIAAIRRGDRNLPAEHAIRIEAGDVLLVTGIDPQSLHDAATRFGRAHPGRMLRDRSDLDYERFFVSNPAVIGR